MTVQKGYEVDKDTILFKDYLNMAVSYSEMSPVLCPPGFTCNYLDNEVANDDLLTQVHHAWNSLSSKHSFMVVEGTRHVGVGTLFDLNNARIVKELGLKIIMIATGGLESSFG